MPQNCFYHHLCQWCGKPDQIKKCAKCKLVSYCSVEHQKFDWILHKTLCKVVQKLVKNGQSLLTDLETTRKNWLQSRIRFMCGVELLSKRKLEIFERQMLLFPNVCNFCFRYNAECHPCVNCQCAFYCSVEHVVADRLDHNDKCKELKLCLDMDIFLQNHCTTDIKKFNFVKNEDTLFPNNIEKYLERYINLDDKLRKVFISETLSFVLTLLNVILKFKDLRSSTRLNIHIIGSNEHEDNTLKFMDLFFCWLPNLKNIDILMIGPDCNKTSMEPIINTGVTIKKEHELYHVYATKAGFNPPDIIIAYNSGFSEYTEGVQDTWYPTIQFILNLKKLLFIMTSYTKKEAENDLSRVMNVGLSSSVKSIVLVEQNPFRSMRPVREWENPGSLFYFNNYLSVLYIV